MSIREKVNQLYSEHTGSTPKFTIMLTSALKYLSSDLYTDTKRFIYELLQNADDSAIVGQNIDVAIKLFDDTLVIAHTGQSFTDRDIEGLCDIDNGTKIDDTSKTGYKGIGFKSVFGQSQKVTIFTNNEYFKFDAKHSFEWKKDWGIDKESWEKENNRKLSYPWQIIPIYLNEFEDDVNNEVQDYLKNENWNVATILKVSKKEEIVNSINELSSNLNKLLFLQNISSIKFEIDETIFVEIEKDENQLILKKDNIVEENWLTKTIQLPISEELKTKLRNDENIPKKLQDTDEIKLTLATKKIEHRLEEVSSNENLIYAYLPTSEKKYSLPVLVNSTFLMASNRENLHTDLVWNEYLFTSISKELFHWIAELVQGEYSYEAYNLIPTKLNIPNDKLAVAYNKGIEEALELIPFIFSKKNELLKVNEAIIDETDLSEKTFIGKKIIKKFIKNKIGEDNKIVESPFVFANKKLKKIDVVCFSWDEIPAFLAFEDFKHEHTIAKNIQLIEYFKREFEISDSTFPKEKLRNWAFLYDHKGKLNYLNKICFPKIDDDNWNNINSDLDYVNERLYNVSIENSNLKLWLQKLGVGEKTDITYLNTMIIPTVTTYCTKENHSKTIKYIYDLYSNEDIQSDTLNQLTNLNLLTTKGTLIPASRCYFSSNYNPKLQIENILDDDIFLSEDYLSLDADRDEIKRFFKLLGVEENIIPIVITTKESKTNLTSNLGFKNNYFLEPDKKFQPFSSIFTANEYRNVVYFRFMKKTKIYDFSKIFWKDLITNSDITILNSLAQTYWGKSGYPGRNTGNSVENYPKWYIKNNKCISTTKGTCEKSSKVFLNSEDIKNIAGKYLPVFDGIELNQDWKSFFEFKTELKLNDYLELLTNIISDKNDEDKIKSDNSKRIQLIFKELLELSTNWGTDEIDKVKLWGSSAYFPDEDGNIVSCAKLKYYADGDNSIFQNFHEFIALDEENKSHHNIEIFLGYLGVEILRQDNFNIDFDGEETESDLKYQLESIFPYLEKWIKKIDSEFDIVALNEKLSTLQINEASKLLLVYGETPLKAVQVHLKDDVLLLTTPWSSNTSMLELPKILCRYLDIKGYEDKLTFLLKADDESEINEYFKNEGIDLPINDIKNVGKEVMSEKERTSLGVSTKEYNDINKISSSFSHTSESSIEKKRYIVSLLKRSKKRILEHLNNLDEYTCDNVDDSALTVMSGIRKNGNDIYIIPRPSDNGKVIIYHDSEFDTLEYSDSELWYEDGVSIPKKLSFGKVLREAKINKIPITRSKEEKTIDIIYNIEGEDTAYEPILPSSFDIAKTMASLANTNGGYFIVGCSKESDILGISAEFNIDERIQESIKYSKYFEELEFQKMDISGKTIIIVQIDKFDKTILIEGKKYIRYGSIIIEELENNTKPIIITEGKTDWKHIKKALERFKNNGLYTDLDIQFLEYENMNMGDGELDRMVQTYCKAIQPRKYIFMFDRDNPKYVKNYAKEEFNNHTNNVYSFCIPKISDELDGICIEFYYKKEDLITFDQDEKRIFLGDEFLDNGNSKCGKYVTEKRKAKALDILDRDKKVYLKSDNEWNNNIALSKNDFTNNVINDVDGFDNFNIEYFKLIFDVIEKIHNK